MVSLHTIYTLLQQHFGVLTGPEAARDWWPIFGDDPAFEMLVGAILVQQTRWETVEDAIHRLIAADLLSPPALAIADPPTLALQLRPVAFHTQKAPGLITIAQHICANYGGSTTAMLARPSAELREELLGLPRIGRETCDVIMLYAGSHPVFVIDEYTRRLFERVLPEHNTQPPSRGEALLWRQPYELLRKAIEQELARIQAAAPLYADFHALINEECVRYCTSRPRCDGPPARRVYSRQIDRESYLKIHEGCPLREVCAWYQEHA